MKQIKFLTVIALLAIVSFTSCKKDEETQPSDTNTNENLVTGTVTLSSNELYKDDWTYFSFSTQAEVSGIDSINFNTLTTWDIAFHSRLGRTNGGNSCIGEGAVYDAGTSDFDAVKTVDTTAFIQDTTVNLITGIGSYGPTYKQVPGNTTFDSAFSVDYTQHPPVYTSNNKVFVVKTSDGKYAKIQILSYYNDKGESGYIKFKYAYRKDGSMNF